MADTLNLYQGGSLVSSAPYEQGKATVTIDSLEANTEYPSGTYHVARQNEHGESEKIEVPAFKTKPISVTGVTITPKTVSVEVGSTTKLSSSVAPSTATNKDVDYSSSDENIATVTTNGTVEGVTEGEATITVKTQDGSKTDKSVITVNAVAEPEV